VWVSWHICFHPVEICFRCVWKRENASQQFNFCYRHSWTFILASESQMCFHVAQPIFVTLSITLSLVAPTEEDELGASEPASTNENFAFQSIELSSTYSLWSSLYNSLIWFLSMRTWSCILGATSCLCFPRRKFALGNWHRGASESENITGDMSATTNLGSATPKEYEVEAFANTKGLHF
jgi:hypothetical protein